MGKPRIPRSEHQWDRRPDSHRPVALVGLLQGPNSSFSSLKPHIIHKETWGPGLTMQLEGGGLWPYISLPPIYSPQPATAEKCIDYKELLEATQGQQLRVQPLGCLCLLPTARETHTLPPRQRFQPTCRVHPELQATYPVSNDGSGAYSLPGLNWHTLRADSPGITGQSPTPCAGHLCSTAHTPTCSVRSKQDRSAKKISSIKPTM